MSKIPPEMENLLWNLAESDNPQAISEFEARFPHLRVELGKRRAMVRSLRNTRPDNITKPSIPRFVPGPAPAAEPTRGMYIAAFVCAAIALSVFGFTAVFTHRPKPPEPYAPVEQVATRQAPEQPAQPVAPTQDPYYQPPTQNSAPPPRSLADEPPVIDSPQDHTAERSWERPQTITMRGAPLHTVLQAVAEEGRLALNVAPGTPNPTISVDYHDQSAESILQDLGKTYAFTPIVSDDGSALIIPAVQQNPGYGHISNRDAGR